ncbi:sulfur carrier protein ThiS [Haloactinospora alba]|uniref:Sulfur carrier protein ThiS n=1 Tax=Haloactinospora alba TaxID=405555 RepID=A0A543NHU7_9ACTN|nr:sulfur carrier protein ThiS [Haloactinospora alba]TQN31330.1 sulfur carrier protein ThiS [Haloactinospora alba]
MNVVINGEQREVQPHTSVGEAVRSVTDTSHRVAVAVNDEVVPRARWEHTELSDNDRVDVLTPVQGG